MAARIDAFLSRNFKIIILVISALVLCIAYAYFALRVVSRGQAEYYVGVLGIFSLALLVLTFWLLKTHRLAFEQVFLIMLCGMGLVYMVMFAPLKAPDEAKHYCAAYRYSNVLLGYGFDGNSSSMHMRADDYDFFTYWKGDIENVTDDYVAERDQLTGTVTNGTVSLYKTYYLSNLGRPPQEHICAAVGLALGRLLGLDALLTYYVGRLTAFLAFAALAYCAVKVTPIAKPAFATIFLLPRTLELATSFSYDGPIIVLSVLFVACCLSSILRSDALHWYEPARLALLAFLLTPCKVVYALVVPLVFFIPQKRFSTPLVGYLIKGGIVAVAVASFLVWSLSNVSSMAAPHAATGTTPAKYSFADMLRRPFHTLKLFCKTIFEPTKEELMLSGQIREIFGWRLANHGSVHGPWSATAAFMLLFTTSVLGEKHESRITPLLRVSCIVLAFVATVGIYTSMLLGFSAATSTWIHGIQGRYFIPLLPLVIIACTGSKRLHLADVSRPALLMSVLWVNLYYAGWLFADILFR